MIFTTTKNKKTTFTKFLWVLFCMFSTQLTFAKIIYVNNNSLTSDVYTTAIGNNANSGLTPALPKLTLAAALGIAVAGDTIYIDTGNYSDSSLTINIALTIIGAGPGNTIFKSNLNNYFVTITSSNVLIKNLTASSYGSNNTSKGQVIDIQGLYSGIIIDNIVFSNSYGSNLAVFGNIHISGGANVTLKNSMSKCSGFNGSYGGGVSVTNSTFTVTKSIFFNNDNLASKGGAIDIQGTSTVNINDFTFDTNTARDGGAIGIQGTSNVTISGSCFLDNKTEGSSPASTNGGGAIYSSSSGTVNITDCSFANNCTGIGINTLPTASGALVACAGAGNSPRGGAIRQTAGTLNLTRVTFIGNSTSGNSSGFDVQKDNGTMSLFNVTFNTINTTNYVNIVNTAGTLNFNNSGQPVANGSGVAVSKPEVTGAGTIVTTNTNVPSASAVTNCISTTNITSCSVAVECPTDTNAPVIIKCVDDKTINCPNSLPDYRSEVAFFDDCTTTITQSPAAGTVLSTGITSVTITIKDSNNNVSTCSFNVTFIGSVAGTISGAGTVCSATNSTTLTLSGSVGTIQWQSSNALAGTYTDIGGAVSATYTVTNLAVTTYYRAIVSIVSCTSATAASVEIKVLASNIWTGSTSTVWNIATNWTCGVPLSGDNIEIPSGLTNYPVLDISRTIGNVIIAPGATLNLNNATLAVSGTFSGLGTLIGGGATSGLTINGSGDQGTFYMNDTEPGTPNKVGNFTLNSTVSGSVTLGNAMGISGILTLTNGTFNTGENLTLTSNGSGTAVVAEITNCLNVAITGNVTVERYFLAGRAFRFISSPVTTTTTIRDNWQEGQNNFTTNYTNNSNSKLGYGTHITGNMTGDYGFDYTQTTNNSMFTFNNSTAAWAAVPNTNTLTLTAGAPYRLMIRGDRSISMSTNNPTATNTTLRAKGKLKLCDASAGTLSQSADGFSFIGNPYQATVDIKAVLAQSTNVNPYYYSVWDPKTNTRGGYVIYDLNSGIKNVGTSNVNAFLQPWQACFVKTTSAGAASITFKESNKATSIVNELVYRTNLNLASYIRLTLYESNSLANNEVAADGLIVKFGDDFDNAIDENDALKFNNQDETFSTKNNTSLLGIESRLFPVASDVIPLKITQYRFTNYTMVASGTNMTGLTAYLHDQLLQTYTEIPQSDSVNYPYVLDTNNAATSASDRFRIVFQNPFLNLESNAAIVFTMSPNPSKQGVFDVVMNGATEDTKLIIYNTIGQEVYATNLTQATINHINPNKVFANGVYYVKIKKDAATTIKKLIIR